MASTVLQPVIACIARTCGMHAVCLLTVAGMSKVILPWTDGCIIVGAEEPDRAATYEIGKSRAVATSRKGSFWISLA